MRFCAACNTQLPYKVKIDGKTRNLANRKLCLLCSPFGTHNTRKVPLDQSPVCRLCGKPSTLRRPKECGSCSVKKARNRKKLRAIEWKGGACEQCGYNRNAAGLIFHHTDPKTKEFGLGEGWNQSWKRVLTELEKCQLLCLICHAELHHPELSIPL